MSSHKHWYQKYSPFVLIGLAGVYEHETHRARMVGRFFSYSTVLVCIFMLWQWHLQLMYQIDGFSSIWGDLLVWIYFAVNFTLTSIVVKNHGRYWRENWLLPLVILSIIPYLINPVMFEHWLLPLRPVIALYFMLPASSLIWGFLMDGKLRTTLAAASLIIVIFGFLVAGFDPNIDSIWDGLWWALATVSTVGYGDVVPTSALGRLLGTILVFLGLGIFVVITANFLALFLNPGHGLGGGGGGGKSGTISTEKLEQKIEDLDSDISSLQGEIKSMSKKIEKLLDKK